MSKMTSQTLARRPKYALWCHSLSLSLSTSAHHNISSGRGRQIIRLSQRFGPRTSGQPRSCRVFPAAALFIGHNYDLLLNLEGDLSLFLSLSLSLSLSISISLSLQFAPRQLPSSFVPWKHGVPQLHLCRPLNYVGDNKYGQGHFIIQCNPRHM
jgi:hypothetical protein